MRRYGRLLPDAQGKKIKPLLRLSKKHRRGGRPPAHDLLAGQLPSLGGALRSIVHDLSPTIVPSAPTNLLPRDGHLSPGQSKRAMYRKESESLKDPVQESSAHGACEVSIEQMC